MSVSDISDVSDTSNVSGYSSDSENSVTAVLSQDADEDLPSPASVDSLVVSDPDGHSSGDDVDALSPNAEDHTPAVQPRRSAISYLNFMRDFNRRHGGTFRGQKMVNVAAQQWRSMDSDQRNQYRNVSYYSGASKTCPCSQPRSDPRQPDYRQKISKSSYSPQSSSTTSLTPSLSDFLASDASSLDEVDCSKKPEPCAKRRRKRKRSCGKKMRKKSACGKRRRKKSACAKKRKASKKSCGKRRRKRRKTC